MEERFEKERWDSTVIQRIKSLDKTYRGVFFNIPAVSVREDGYFDLDHLHPCRFSVCSCIHASAHLPSTKRRTTREATGSGTAFSQ